ncbi:ATP-binding protein [Microlunatus sp. GCM10028923]|uniref:ATP-binding protein n=1 Tax=Microlunatus sp. GCM10028923 TaxID=3273400 RepID=UPI0036135D72
MTSGSRRSMADGLDGLAGCVLSELPRLPTSTDSGGADARPTDRQRRLAALVSAFHADSGPVVLCWHRATASGPVEVRIAGAGLVSATAQDAESALLSLPAGGRGRLEQPGELAATLRGVPSWAAISVVSDSLLVEDRPEPAAPEPLRPTLEDCLLGVWHGPFSWVLIAEPVADDDLDEAVAAVGNEKRRAAARGESSPDYAVLTSRLEARHRELSQAATTGLWRIGFAAGGETPEAARRIAALVCASADTAQLPYALRPGRTASAFDEALMADDDPTGGYVSTQLLAAIATPPSVELPGVRFRLRPEFDVTPEPLIGAETAGPGLPLGTVLDRNRLPAGPLAVPRSSLNRHTFVCGATGAGKSQTIRGMLENAAVAGLPWLVVEPAKAEYRLMAARLAGTGHRVIAIRPGDPDAVPAGLNPLEPGVDAEGRRYPLQTHLDLVRALFLAAFEADEPFPQVLSAALTRCYEEAGWDLALGEPAEAGTDPAYPTLADLQRTAMAVVEDIGYGREITDNVRGFISVRLASLRLGTTGRFLEGGHPLDLDALLRSNVVFEIEDVGDDRDKAFLMGTVLIRLVEHLRLLQKHDQLRLTGLRHLSVFEEAHRLLRNATEGPAAHAVEMFADLLAEIRAYGEGLIIAEQIPSKLLPDVIKNTAIKIVHRLPAQDDRDAVGATMNITDAQSDYLVTLTPGQAAVFTDGMDYPLLAAMPDGTTRERTEAVPDGPADLVGRRSSTCGTDCQDTIPCTLRQIRTAERLLDTAPLITIWAELAVVAHLTGWATPVPEERFRTQLIMMDARARDCALSHAVDQAIGARATVLPVGSSGFADEVAALLRSMVAEGADAASTVLDVTRVARPYRWHAVRDELVVLAREMFADWEVRIAKWERTIDEPIPGATPDEKLQHATERADRELNLRDENAYPIAFGHDAEPRLFAAVGADPYDHHWDSRLGEILKDFVDCSWPAEHFAEATRADRASATGTKAGT